MEFTIKELADNVLEHLKGRIVSCSKDGLWSFNEDYVSPPHVTALQKMGVKVIARSNPGKNTFFTISW